MKTIVHALSFALCTVGPALACDAPGTPNPVSATAINASTIQLKITNTAKEGSSHTIWFLAEDTSGVGGAFGNIQRFTPGRIANGASVIFNETNLQANVYYGFRIWTRDDSPQGCRSEQPSGFVYALTKPPYGTPQDTSPLTMGVSTPPVSLAKPVNFNSNNVVGAAIYIQYSGLVPNSQIQIEMNQHDPSIGSVTSNTPVITVDSGGYGTFAVPNALIPASPRYVQIKALQSGKLLTPPVQFPSSLPWGTPLN